MKKLLYTAALMVVVSGSTFAADDFKKAKETKITTYVQQKFDTDYAAAQRVTWTVVDDLYKATFTLNGKPMTALYDWENKLVSTTYAVEKEELAPKALERIARNYKEYEVSSVLKQFDGKTSYFAVLEKENKRIVVRVSDNCVFFHKRLN